MSSEIPDEIPPDDRRRLEVFCGEKLSCSITSLDQHVYRIWMKLELRWNCWFANTFSRQQAWNLVQVLTKTHKDQVDRTCYLKVFHLLFKHCTTVLMMQHLMHDQQDTDQSCNQTSHPPLCGRAVANTPTHRWLCPITIENLFFFLTRYRTVAQFEAKAQVGLLLMVELTEWESKFCLQHFDNTFGNGFKSQCGVALSGKMSVC